MSELRAPPRLAMAYESLTGLEMTRLLLSLPALGRLPRGRDRPVMVLPGFSADDASTFALRSVLRGVGHDVRGWELGRNLGNVPATIPRVVRRVRQLARATGDRVALVGWSLGGYLAREAAREAPDAVRRVVTLGSPIRGGAKYTQLARLYSAQGWDLDSMEAMVEARAARHPIEVPVTVLYSRYDGVVAWQACVDDRERLAENVAVGTTHFGFGYSAEVFRIVAERLARPDPAAKA